IRQPAKRKITYKSASNGASKGAAPYQGLCKFFAFLLARPLNFDLTGETVSEKQIIQKSF
ncbi:MAG: hypothetical protein J6B77_09355, partial [Clostridia bacterium]|nr:hypothetical protein [Clostridia bacterium]